MAKVFTVCVLILTLSCNKQTIHSQTTIPSTMSAKSYSLYDFSAPNIYGETFNFSDLKGKKVMIVNTASECGLTPQYKQLEELYQEYKNQDFTIVGFPANNFGQQEPGTNAEIVTFCEANYGVSFPMMSKISVKGEDIHPIYQFLTRKDKNGVLDSEVQWNFQKYLINEDGTLAQMINPQTLPTDEVVLQWIEGK